MEFKKLLYGLISKEKLFCLLFFSGAGVYYFWKYTLYRISFEFNYLLLMVIPLISIGAFFFSILLKDVMRIWAKIDLRDEVMMDTVNKKKVTLIFFRGFTSVHFFFFFMLFMFSELINNDILVLALSLLILFYIQFTILSTWH